MPRVEQFWYKYSLMEEMLGELESVRKIFDDWMTWQPSEFAWNAYLKFEQRHGDLDKCRMILEKFIDVNPVPASFVKAANFEEH